MVVTTRRYNRAAPDNENDVNRDIENKENAIMWNFIDKLCGPRPRTCPRVTARPELERLEGRDTPSTAQLLLPPDPTGAFAPAARTAAPPPTAPVGLRVAAVPAAAVAQTAQLRGATYFTGTPLTDTFLRKLHDEGARVLRIQVLDWGPTATGFDVTDPAGYQRWVRSQIQFVRDNLSRLQQYGVRAIINLHVAPLMPPGQWTLAGQGDAMRRLFMRGPDSDVRRKAFYDAWLAFSSAFKNDSRVVGYDLLNEPELPARADRAFDYNDLMKEAVKRIRNNHDDKLVIIESVGANPDHLGALETVKDRNGRNDPNVEYSFHLYGLVGSDGTWRSKQSVVDILDRVKKWQADQARNGAVRIYVGELGTGIPDTATSDFIQRNLAQAQRFLRQCVNEFNARGWDWAYFEFYRDVTWATGGELDFLMKAYKGQSI